MKRAPLTWKGPRLAVPQMCSVCAGAWRAAASAVTRGHCPGLSSADSFPGPDVPRADLALGTLPPRPSFRCRLDKERARYRGRAVGRVRASVTRRRQPPRARGRLPAQVAQGLFCFRSLGLCHAGRLGPAQKPATRRPSATAKQLPRTVHCLAPSCISETLLETPSAWRGSCGQVSPEGQRGPREAASPHAGD